MTYTVERLHSCVGETRDAIFRLTYETTYIPDLNTWRHFLVGEQELHTAQQGETSAVVPRTSSE